MPRLNFVVVGDDQTRTEVVAGPREQLAFEKARKVGLGQALNPGTQKIEDVYFLAWLALKEHCKRQGEGQPPLFEEWIDTIYDIELVSEVESAPLDG